MKDVKDFTKIDENTIKHLVFSGGGPAGLINYGAAMYLEKNGVWNIKNIKSIYGCSIGAFIGVIISLGYEWEWVNDYFIKRPWEKVFTLTAQSFIDAYEQKGLLGEKIILDCLKPLLCAKDLIEETTLKDLYEFNNIDIHMYTTNINSDVIEKVDLSHTTHPDLTVIKAISMSASYPFGFKPICMDGACYIDGGLLNNYPLNDCLKQTNCKEDEVISFKNTWINTEDQKITEECSIIEYLVCLMKKMQNMISTDNSQLNIKNTVNCKIEGLSGLNNWLNSFPLAIPKRLNQLNFERSGTF